jgi:hypothetical protein
MAQPYAVAGIEPPLEELLDDRIARLVMRRDGIEPADVWRWVHEARSRWTHMAETPAATERPGRDVAPPPGIGD